MTAARDEILRRIRVALADVDPAADVEVPRDYRQTGDLDAQSRFELFVARLEEYRATVIVADHPATGVAAILRERGACRVVVAPDLPAAVRPPGLELVVDADLSAPELDTCDAVVTTCAAACAETGTLALDGGPGQGRRALTLVPDLHVCVVGRDQIVQTLPELFARLEPSARAGNPIVLVSGPSATSDIELARVEGVHGPRQLVVVIAP